MLHTELVLLFMASTVAWELLFQTFQSVILFLYMYESLDFILSSFGTCQYTKTLHTCTYTPYLLSVQDLPVDQPIIPKERKFYLLICISIIKFFSRLLKPKHAQNQNLQDNNY